MSGQAPESQWFLARDGKQVGPLNDAEIGKFVEFGHLRDGDLVWRSDFTEWRAAFEVFPQAAKPRPAPPSPPAPPPVEKPAAAPPTRPMAAEPAPPSADPSQGKTATPGPMPLPAGAQSAAPGPVVGRTEPGRGPAPVFARTLPEQPASGGPSRSPGSPGGPGSLVAPGPGPRTPADLYAARPGVGPDGRPMPRERGSQDRFSDRLAVPAPGPEPAGIDRPPDDDVDALEPPSRRGRGAVRAMLAAGVLGLIAGGGWLAVQHQAVWMPMVGLGADRGGASSPLLLNASRESLRTSPFAGKGETQDAVDGAFQRTAVWRLIKQEFPEWYEERTRETARLSAEKQDDAAIAKYLADALVSLRRKHADQALAASPARLRFVASSFLDNLQALSQSSVEACYGYISQGESAPSVLTVIQEPRHTEPFQRQVAAVFDAIAEGRKAPRTHLPPRKSDYDALAAELQTRGWSQADLRLFSDPRALGRAQPERVCKMVQDWFAAQIAIKDQEAQVRLLVESLRPVVAG